MKLLPSSLLICTWMLTNKRFETAALWCWILQKGRFFEVRETAADGVDEEIREEILRQLDRIVQLIVTISPHIEGGKATLRSVIDVRQSVREEVEASIVR